MDTFLKNLGIFTCCVAALLTLWYSFFWLCWVHEVTSRADGRYLELRHHYGELERRIYSLEKIINTGK